MLASSAVPQPNNRGPRPEPQTIMHALPCCLQGLAICRLQDVGQPLGVGTSLAVPGGGAGAVLAPAGPSKS
jgi:hypothetical protein